MSLDLKAEKLGVKILDEAAFAAMLREADEKQ
jgi:hypothetical protein